MDAEPARTDAHNRSSSVFCYNRFRASGSILLRRHRLNLITLSISYLKTFLSMKLTDVLSTMMGDEWRARAFCSARRLARRAQVLAEKFQHVRVELLVEVGAIEARRIGAYKRR